MKTTNTFSIDLTIHGLIRPHDPVIDKEYEEQYNTSIEKMILENVLDHIEVVFSAHDDDYDAGTWSDWTEMEAKLIRVRLGDEGLEQLELEIKRGGPYIPTVSRDEEFVSSEQWQDGKY